MSPQPQPRLHLRVVAQSEVGLVRKMNQDSGYASPHLLVVADGMGGAAAGDLASAVAIDVIKQLDTPDLLAGVTAPGDPAADPEPTADGTEETVVVDLDPSAGRSSEQSTGARVEAGAPQDRPTPEQGAAGRNPLLGTFAAAIEEANSRIADLVADDYSLEGMGTTVSGAIFDGERLALAHIGDSRGYLLRDGRLERLTHDHSWVQSLVDDGKISPEEAAYHPHRSLLLKVLNGQPANDPDLTTVSVRAGDRVLFCSDGLCGMVDDEDIARLAAQPDLDAAVTDLVDAALAAGGIDNITVILAEVLEGPEVAPAPPPAVETDEDDTAVRWAVVAGAVLGAATERDIPVVPRRRTAAAVVPGFDDDPEDGPPDPPPAASAAPASDHPDDESRYAPRPPTKRRAVRTLLVGLAVLLITAAGLGAGYAWTRTQYFVGASDGQVAIYTGLPDGIPGLPLSQLYEVQELPVASLPPYYQAQVTAGIEVSSLDAARVTVDQLKEAARRCTQPSPSPTPTPTRSATPKSSATPKNSATPKSSATPKTPENGATPKTTTSTTAAASLTPAPTPTPTGSPLPGEC